MFEIVGAYLKWFGQAGYALSQIEVAENINLLQLFIGIPLVGLFIRTMIKGSSSVDDKR